MQDGIKKRLKIQIAMTEDYILDLRLKMVRNPELMYEVEIMLDAHERNLLDMYVALEMFDEDEPKDKK